MPTGGDPEQQPGRQSAGHPVGLPRAQDPHRHPPGGHSQGAKVLALRSLHSSLAVCWFLIRPHNIASRQVDMLREQRYWLSARFTLWLSLLVPYSSSQHRQPPGGHAEGAKVLALRSLHSLAGFVASLFVLTNPVWRGHILR